MNAAQSMSRFRLAFAATLCRALLASFGFLSGRADCAAQAVATQPEIYQPVADPSATITLAHARFTVLTPQLVRMEWAADGRFEDHASFVFLNRRLPVPPFQSHVTRQGALRILTIDTAALHLVYKATPTSDRFDSNDLSIAIKPMANLLWHPGMPDSGNLGGTARTLDRVNGSSVKLETGLISRDGWVLVDDSTRPLFDSADFSMSGGEDSKWPWVLQRPPGDRLDWYFFGYGHDYRKALGDFVRVAGRIPLPPRYAFGNWWSRYWAYSDQELNELVEGYRSRNIPLDVLVIDMDWHLAFRGNQLDQSGHRKGWTGYTWNRNLFPYPELFLKGLHDEGLKVTLNLHPASGVQPFEEAYPAMTRAMGQDPNDQKYVPFQITDRKFVDNYFSILHHPLEKEGIDFWWLDWQQEDNTAVPGVNPTFWLNYLHFTDQEREGKRPLLFHRWGGLGNHRYQIGFSGDVISSWDSLAFQTVFTAQAANVGYGYWSHDIGGHIPGRVDPELYTRWVQFGAFSPILRTHTTKNADAERRVWAYPEPYSDVMADTMRLRYAWIPYIYTEARRTYDMGVAFIHPLYYDWPAETEAYRSPNEYMFGDQVMAAPVTSSRDPKTGLSTESIWLPEGEWIEQPTGAHLHGPARIERAFSLQQIPLYERPGSIIPMQPPMLNTAAKPVDPLILRIARLSDHESSTYTLYEDSSAGRNYMTGEFATTALHAARTGNVLTITVDSPKGSYPGMITRRAIEVQLPGDWPPVRVEANGHALPYSKREEEEGWWFTGNTLTTNILTPPANTNAAITIVVTRDPQWLADTNLLDGFAGKLTALRRAYDLMNSTWPVDDLVAAMQTGDRISYHPETALGELQRLPRLMRSALDAVHTMQARQHLPANPERIDAAASDRATSESDRLAAAEFALRQLVDVGSSENPSSEPRP